MSHSRKGGSTKATLRGAVVMRFAPRNCEREACGKRYDPANAKQRFCSADCRLTGETETLDVASVELRAMGPIDRAEREMRNRWVVSGWALEQRRERQFHLWCECLALAYVGPA